MMPVVAIDSIFSQYPPREPSSITSRCRASRYSPTLRLIGHNNRTSVGSSGQDKRTSRIIINEPPRRIFLHPARRWRANGVPKGDNRTALGYCSRRQAGDSNRKIAMAMDLNKKTVKHYIGLLVGAEFPAKTAYPAIRERPAVLITSECQAAAFNLPP